MFLRDFDPHFDLRTPLSWGGGLRVKVRLEVDLGRVLDRANGQRLPFLSPVPLILLLVLVFCNYYTFLIDLRYRETPVFGFLRYFALLHRQKQR